MKISQLIAVCVLAATLGSTGCSGGGSPVVGGTKFYPISTKLRALQPGDNWSWKYSETSITTNGDVPVEATTMSTGTWLDSVSSAVLNGQNYLVQTVGVADYPPPNSGLNGFTSPPTYDYTQDATSRTLYRTGTYDSLLAAPVLYLPGNWYAGYSNTASSTFPNGMTYTLTFTVVDQESVTVPAGTFMTWKTNVVETTSGLASKSSPTVITGTCWYAPQIGNFVKASTLTTSTNYIGVDTTQNTTFDFQLSSTNTL